MTNLPPKLQEIVDDFASASREEKIEMLVQYSGSLPPLPEWLYSERDKMATVPECMTQVFLAGQKQPDGSLTFYFDIPLQSPTVRGLAAILASGLNGCKPEEIITLPADFYLPMKLEEAVSFQRLNGFQGVLAHMKQEAAKFLNK
jgi:cysteine desulfuration protein SufE